MDTVHIGLLGLGTVGSGVAKLLLECGDRIAQRAGVRLNLKRAAEKNAEAARAAGVPGERLTDDAHVVVSDPEVSIVVELIGGIRPAKDFIEAALRAGKAVVTANKALLAEHGPELFALAQANDTCIAFEASVGGGIPIVAAARDGLIANDMEYTRGIVNGTCNYILTQMTREGTPYADALAEAQRLGYAEADPTLDVGGGDSAHKLAVLARLVFGLDFAFEDVYCEGISDVDVTDIRYAQEMGYVLKLLAIAKQHDGELELRVHPTLLHEDTPLAAVSGVFNAIHVKGHAVGDAMLYGRGAGQMPTASAVVADLVDVALGRAQITFKHTWLARSDRRRPANVRPMVKIESRYYVRLMAHDQPGVLAQVAGIFGQHHISIASVNQHEPHDASEGYVPVVFTTHAACEGSMQQALRGIEALDVIRGQARLLRLEE